MGGGQADVRRTVYGERERIRIRYKKDSTQDIMAEKTSKQTEKALNSNIKE